MSVIHVNASRDYDIHIGPGLLAQAGAHIKPFCPGGTCAVVTLSLIHI